MMTIEDVQPAMRDQARRKHRVAVLAWRSEGTIICLEDAIWTDVDPVKKLIKPLHGLMMCMRKKILQDGWDQFRLALEIMIDSVSMLSATPGMLSRAGFRRVWRDQHNGRF
jgi:hypothetical protein